MKCIISKELLKATCLAIDVMKTNVKIEPSSVVLSILPLWRVERLEGIWIPLPEYHGAKNASRS